MGSLIRVEQLTKQYLTDTVKTSALSKVDLSIENGEFVSIFGKSGSGKSTLLSILGLLDRSSSGKYFLRDVDTSILKNNQLAALRNKYIGFIFQQFNLIDSMTVLGNVCLPLIYAGVDTKTAHTKAMKVLAELDMQNREQHKPSQLSGGQQQRVAIARALINEPALLLVDEPTGNLDRKNSERVMDILSQLHQHGRTICLVTHDADYAARASRIIELNDGEIVSE